MPDEKPVHDRIIEHDLHALTPEQTFKLLVIEFRELRTDIREFLDSQKKA